ncbi:MAG: TlpA family protein disulfide reductase [gamma proteobacterium symbiont of Bathyaustriella thionipta]|nr:TlpA family protein disulfide reductase [gamma proteobacterium symbiont of Bathyaustriella thionipta]MCU7950721.1 TlpA family protein disulfide reductase [gamma proteobacterium symbiont of Bathyaustriella thionipta]MCU7953280.1 TlpA family protein disulfide reductase [gamma proteobacterium symbiont of Bathyaustriella thionipta]MCU7957213.1 TlpA family protein disulfide reductase [gamma proteobacterium symbiont of Bathyaustriella thionipta]MCU7966529.1 TlpA family protein disulfide reductase 
MYLQIRFLQIKFQSEFKSAFILSLFITIVLHSSLVFSEQSLTSLSKAQPAPGFSLLDMDGVKHQLSDYKGQPVIINFWATWCPPCRAEMPSMERAWNKIKDECIAMLAINVGEDEDTVFTFLGDYPANFTILLDQSGAVSEQWPVRGLPTTFIVSPDGQIVYRAIGGREWDDEQLLDQIRQIK